MGKPAPQFTLPDVSGKQVKLSDFKGQVVLLNFSTDWSSVYMAQMVQLAGLHREHSARGLKTILVLLDKEEMQTARSFMETYDVSCPLLMGNQQVAQLYGVQEHASATFLVDREGKVSKNSGNLEANIRKLLSEEHLKAPNK